MSESDDFYTPERVDEQIDALFHIRETNVQDQVIAHHLRSVLLHTSEEQQQADAQVLQRVLQKFLHDPSFVQEPARNDLPFAERVIPIRKAEWPVRASRQRSFARLLMTLAAVLVIAALVGSMALVIRATRLSAGSPSTGVHQKRTPTPTPTPAQTLPEGQVVYLSSPYDIVTTTVWSPDGRRVATAIDGTVKSWDALSGKNVITYQIGKGVGVANVAWSPDGSLLAVCTGSTITLFNARTAQVLRTISPPSQATGNIASSSVMTANWPGQSTGAYGNGTPAGGTTPLNSRAPLSGGGFSNVVWSPDGSEIASGFNVGIYPGLQHTVSVWNVASGQIVKAMQSATNIPSVSWSPKSNLLAAFEYSTTSTDATLALWNTSTWAQVQAYPNIQSFDWSPDGKQLALGKTGPQIESNTIEIIDTLNWHQVKQFAVDSVNEIHWSPDGTRLLVDTGSIWSVSSGKKLYTFHDGASEGAWSPDSRYISCFVGVRTIPRTSLPGAPSDLQWHILVWVA